MAHLVQELKARNVIRNCTLYVAIAFGLLELTDIITGPLNLPDWTLTAVILTSVLGFPVAVLLFWLFMATPDGIRRYPKNFRGTVPEQEEDRLSIEDGRFSGYSYADGEIVFESDIPELTPSGRSARRVGRMYSLSSLTLLSLVVVFFLFYGGRSAPFQERDWVVLADFVNHTGEEIFDQSLNTAFGISIDQSRHINVISRNRMQEALKRIGQDPNAPIGEKLCRDIAMREGARVYIVPEISRVGHQYILTGTLQETNSGRIVASEIVYSRDQEDIIPQLDRISRRMRRHLGESRYKISGQNRPLAQVTTSSLDALKQFSLGIEAHHAMDFEKAVGYYRNAIGLDSTFTSAKASLGNILFERYDPVEGKKWLDEAMLGLDDLTDREQNGIQAFYAEKIEKDLDKALRFTELNVELYPDDVSARNNMGWYNQNQGRYREAQEHYRKAIAIDPYSMLPWGGLIWIFNEYTGEADSVIIWSKRMLEYAPDNSWAWFYLGSAYFPLGEIEMAEEAFEKAMPELSWLRVNVVRLSNTKRVLGKHKEAIEVLQDFLASQPDQTNVMYQIGLNYRLMGEEEEALFHFRKFLDITDFWLQKYPDNPQSFYSHALVLSRLGEMDKGLKAAETAFSMDGTTHVDYADVLAVQGYADQAINQVELALEKGYRDFCWLKMNPDLASLQEEERFLALLDEYFK